MGVHGMRVGEVNRYVREGWSSPVYSLYSTWSSSDQASQQSATTARLPGEEVRT